MKKNILISFSVVMLLACFSCSSQTEIAPKPVEPITSIPTTFVKGALESPEFRAKVKEQAILDAKKTGKTIKDISPIEYRIGAHFSPGYYSNYSSSAKRTKEELIDFMFKD